MASESNPNSLKLIEGSNSNVKVDYNDEIDRISDLPDSLLCHILSFLPTKEAATASFLSSRWMHIFWSIPNLKLDFDDTQIDPIQFVDFVDGVLFNCKIMDTRVHTLRFSCKQRYGNDIVNKWIYAASKANVRSLESRFVRLPESIWSCTSLTTLKLVKNNLFLQDSFCLPNLMSLDLEHIQLDDETTVANLLNGCPVLEELIMVECRVYAPILEICFPKLKRLRMEHSSFETNEIVLNTPALEELCYYDNNAAPQYTVTELKSIRVALLDVKSSEEEDEAQPSVNFDSSVAELVMTCFKAKYLYLSSQIILAIIRSPRVLIPLFSNLKSLDLGFVCPRSWSLLLHLLDPAPNLFSLRVELGFRDYERCVYCIPAFADRVPDCFTLKFGKVSIWNFTGANQEFSFVEYFLKHAMYLQKMEISFSPKVKTDAQFLIKENLLTLPSRSKSTCQLVFS